MTNLEAITTLIGMYDVGIYNDKADILLANARNEAIYIAIKSLKAQENQSEESRHYG